MSARDPYNRFLFMLYGACVALLFLFAWLLPQGRDVLAINGTHTPALDSFFKTVTYVGDGLVFLFVMLVLAFYRVEYSVTALVAWNLHGILSSVFKRLVFAERLRPREVIDNSLLYFVPDVEVHSYFSFPSGHSMTAFCAAFLVSLVVRNRLLSILLLVVALMVGCSRIYLLQHFLIDVAGGALIGVLSAYAAWRIMARIEKPQWMHRRLKLR